MTVDREEINTVLAYKLFPKRRVGDSTFLELFIQPVKVIKDCRWEELNRISPFKNDITKLYLISGTNASAICGIIRTLSRSLFFQLELEQNDDIS